MSHSQTFKVARLSVILLFILALVAIVIGSGKQLVITKRVEVPVYVSETNETNTEDILEENHSNSELKTEARNTVKEKILAILLILWVVSFIVGLVFYVLEDCGITTDKDGWMLAFWILSFVFFVSAAIWGTIG